MSTEDVKKLIKNNQIIGLHSHSHLGDMSQLNYRKQLIDYKKNISFIKEKFKLTPNSMSHPFGRYNFNTLRILKANGIKIGFLSHLNKGKIQSNLEIPRLDHMYIGNKILYLRLNDFHNISLYPYNEYKNVVNWYAPIYKAINFNLEND